MQNSINDANNKYYLMGGIVCCLIFLFLIAAVNWYIPVAQLNAYLNQYVENKLPFSFLRYIALLVSLLGDKYVIIPTVLLTGFFFQRQKRFSLHFIIVVILAMLLASFFKNSLAIPRPDVFIQLNKFAFPSRHVSLCSSYLIFLSLIITQQIKHYKWLVVVSALTLILLESLSRMILGVHWLTDVVGGILLGAACALFVVYHYNFKPTPIQNLRSFVKIFIMIFCLISLFYLFIYWTELIKEYKFRQESGILDFNLYIT
ncbi:MULTISPECIES: phosphatase PAP2 family protein [Legionella]|uniref:undecaprenyl-diphosphate phosphatase n=1 Tax=Legionella drozanskii LLAP-1 TaxID=1212489 RepID=A0A0W0T0V2_9GAMM|nr:MULTISPECIES: phosphatase PAP2 family protein [Legionella]KTC89235.1 PAP2 superfamily protein [Legionella drozanskii LLAP-1]